MKFNNLKILLLLIILIIPTLIYSQSGIEKFLKGFVFTSSLNYVSSASIQLYPNSSDIIERNSTVETTNGGYGYGFSLRKKIFADEISIGISTEYIKITDDQLSTVLENDYDFIRVRVSETVEMIPIELSVNFNVPRFVENLNVYLGGGGGFYFGNRTRKMLNMETATLSKSPLFSLNVLFGAEYMIDKHFSLNFEMKVRDGKFKVRSSFPVNYFTTENQTYYFPKEFESKIFIDGLKLSLGVGYHF